MHEFMFSHNSQITYNCFSQINKVGMIQLTVFAKDCEFTTAFREITRGFTVLLTRDPDIV